MFHQVNCWFGLVVWIPGITLWKRLLLKGHPWNPEAPTQTSNLPLVDFMTPPSPTNQAFLSYLIFLELECVGNTIQEVRDRKILVIQVCMCFFAVQAVVFAMKVGSCMQLWWCNVCWRIHIYNHIKIYSYYYIYIFHSIVQYQYSNLQSVVTGIFSKRNYPLN